MFLDLSCCGDENIEIVVASFTTKSVLSTAHPERKAAFTKAVEQSGRIHALVPKLPLGARV